MENALKISALLQPLIEPARRDAVQLLQRLQIGQQLPARVIDLPAPGVVRLKIGVTSLLARSSLPLARDARITLQVEKTGQLPELRVLQQLGPQLARRELLRSGLARQLPARDVVSAARELAARPEAARSDRAGTTAKTLQTLTRPLLELTRTNPRPSPAAVRQAVLQSGLFLETHLAAGRQPPPQDSKYQLLQALALLKPPGAGGPGSPDRVLQAATDPQAQVADGRAAAGEARPLAAQFIDRLVRLVEGSIARLQSQQAVAVPGDDNQGRLFWQMEIPVRVEDELHCMHLRIEQEENHAHGRPDDTWQVNLAFDFADLGAVQSRVRLNGRQVAVTFWCEQERTSARFANHLPQLEQALLDAGLEPGHLASVQGRPDPDCTRLPVPDNLLDERA